MNPWDPITGRTGASASTAGVTLESIREELFWFRIEHPPEPVMDLWVTPQFMKAIKERCAHESPPEGPEFFWRGVRVFAFLSALDPKPYRWVPRDFFKPPDLVPMMPIPGVTREYNTDLIRRRMFDGLP